TWDIILPLALPGIVAGSIFTFSLTLGDYVTPLLVGGAGSSFIVNVVYGNVGIAHYIPLAAALAVVPVAVMALYLLGARRLGAFESMSRWKGRGFGSRFGSGRLESGSS